MWHAHNVHTSDVTEWSDWQLTLTVIGRVFTDLMPWSGCDRGKNGAFLNHGCPLFGMACSCQWDLGCYRLVMMIQSAWIHLLEACMSMDIWVCTQMSVLCCTTTTDLFFSSFRFILQLYQPVVLALTHWCFGLVLKLKFFQEELSKDNGLI